MKTPAAEPLQTSERAATPGAEVVLTAALEAFHELGYGGTSVREIARRAGLTVAGLYYHFESKHEVLFTLMRWTMEQVMGDAEASMCAAAPAPVDQLRALVTAHVRFHTLRQAEAFVASAELRSLDGSAYDEIISLRDRYESTLQGVIKDGVDSGVFTVRHVQLAARATLAMCTAVANWYRADGPLGSDELAAQYADLVLHLVGCLDPELTAAASGQ